MSKFTEYLSTWFISDEEIEMRREVAASQQAILDRQYAEGKRGFLEYLSLSGEIEDAGNYTADYRDANDDFIKVIPWWTWLVLAGVVFWYLGGFIWLRNILAKQ